MMRDPMLDNARLEPLLARIKMRDRAAFRALYDESAAHLLGVALRILGTRSLAEEALQDAFTQVWQRAGEYEEGRGPAAWLNAIVRYRALDLLRRGGREMPIEDAPEALLATFDAPAGDDADLARCLSHLAPEARASITLAFVEGYSHPELARRLGKPLGTVKSWIRRGLAQLKECLSR